MAHIAAHFRVSVDALIPSSSLVYDLGADSSDVLDLCIQLSDKYQCELDTDKMSRLKTVQDLCNLVLDARS